MFRKVALLAVASRKQVAARQMRCRGGSRLGAAVAVLALMLSAADAGASISSISAAPSRDADDVLAKCERVASHVDSFVKANQRLLSAVGGSLLLMHGQVRMRHSQTTRPTACDLRMRHFLPGPVLARVSAHACALTHTRVYRRRFRRRSSSCRAFGVPGCPSLPVGTPPAS